MKIVFKRHVPKSINAPFGIYEYDETLAQHRFYIDVRGIVRKNCRVWLDELQDSHAKLSRAFVHYTRFWWVSPMSRLAPKPWGQERNVKPFFFTKAVMEWINNNPNENELFLINCDPIVGAYLKEFDQKGEIELQDLKPVFPSVCFQFCKSTLIAILLMLREAFFILRYHVCRSGSKITYKAIVLYELVSGNSMQGSFRYFFGTLFDSIDDCEGEVISYVCSSTRDMRITTLETNSGKSRFRYFLLDNINFKDLIIAVMINSYIVFISCYIGFRKIPCLIGRNSSSVFWSSFIFFELGRVPFLNGICCYRALRKLLTAGKCRLCIYPYEEKGNERAFLFACQELNVATIGYAPHPQHRLSLALRQTLVPASPQPLAFRVCGPAYAEYSVSWCGKNRDSVRIWGSGKCFEKIQDVHILRLSGLRVLLLLSHPNELKVFFSWLRSERRLTASVQYLIRAYKGAGANKFREIFTQMSMEVGCIAESRGTLVEDLNQSDLAIFCGTSAGPVAVKHGYLAIYADLNDFFEINPCFDDLDAMLPCRSPGELADQYERICSLNSTALLELHNRQKRFAETIFSPIQPYYLNEDLLC